MQSKSFRLNLCFLGQRDYVNGLTLFEEMLTSFCRLTGQSVAKIENIDYFKVNNFVRNDCLFSTQLEYEFSADELKSSAAMLNLSAGGQKHICLLHQIKSAQVVKRLPDYDRAHYIKNIIDKECERQSVFLKEINSITDLIRGIIEANHRFCLNEAKKAGLKLRASWAYLKNFRMPVNIKKIKNCSVEFDTISIVDIYEKIFIIRQIKLWGVGDTPAELCFFLDKN
jgi:hypothetical protein